MKLPEIFPVCCHTDQVGPGSTFVVIQGMTYNGAQYISRALEKGADTIVVDQPLSVDQQKLIKHYGATVTAVPNARAALAYLSAQATYHAHKKLKIIGITGTKGKTTTAALLFHLLRTAGKKVALISTVYNAINDERFSSCLTTPQPDYLHQFFKLAVDDGVEWMVMEVAAQAVTLHRIDGLQFDAAALLNIGREHLEFYKEMPAYAEAKFELLKFRKAQAPAFLNADDSWLQKISAEHIHWFGINTDFFGTVHPTSQLSLHCTISYHNESYSFQSDQLCGKYNLYNLMAAIALARDAGISWEQLQNGVRTFSGIPGRLERYDLPNGAQAIIDYAHNPLSYQALFETMRLQTDHLIILFGAGGERDEGRRPEMGAIAAHYADIIILTSDNPRSEDPAQIIADIKAGIPKNDHHKVIVEFDRAKAIKTAYAHSQKGSMMLLLGKGPDEYQLINGKKYPFSERQLLAVL